METLGGLSWTRWTRDQALIDDANMRKEIRWYRYADSLAVALWDLEQAGALRNGCCTWFGGSKPHDNLQGAYSGARNSTASEITARLAEFLNECEAKNVKHQAAIAAAKLLVVPGCIETVGYIDGQL